MSSKGDQGGEVVKRLFPPTPEKAATKRTPLHYTFWRSKNKRSSFRTGILGALIFLALCVSVVIVTAKLNNGWTQLTLDEIHRFFSNELLRSSSPDNRSLLAGHFYFGGQPLFGFLGALPLALALGSVCGAFTCLFMFYDSDEPGSYPPTPVSPPRHKRGEISMSTEWHLGYLFVPINILVSFSLALFYCRWSMGLPML